MKKAKLRKAQHNAAARRERERTILDPAAPQQNRAARRLMKHAQKRNKQTMAAPSVFQTMTPSARWGHPAPV
jgi:hypothetical protein